MMYVYMYVEVSTSTPHLKEDSMSQQPALTALHACVFVVMRH